MVSHVVVRDGAKIEERYDLLISRVMAVKGIKGAIYHELYRRCSGGRDPMMISAAVQSGLGAEARQFLTDQLRRDPDPRHVPAFVHCWEEAGLPTDPVDVARRILRGEYADPPG